jgi:hypoxanthine phosphoribosyltransferase
MAQAQRPPFAHESEAELARILDFYGVRWEYEPHTFPILWNLQGDVLESFSPDFYLPDLDLYVELTTLKQRLVRKKNRKLRRLRELYPEIRIKLFYGRDFRQLMLKYGKLALADDLSGSTGQVALPYAPVEAPVEPPAGSSAGSPTGSSAEVAVGIAPPAPASKPAASASGPVAASSLAAGTPAESRRRRRVGKRGTTGVAGAMIVAGGEAPE